MFLSDSNASLVVKRVLPIVALLAVLFLEGCTSSIAVQTQQNVQAASEAAQVNRKVTLTVLVSYFEREALHDDFADGTSKSYDLMVLRVLQPDQYQGLELQIANESHSDVKPVELELDRTYIVEVEKSVVDAAKEAGRPVHGASSSVLYISPKEIHVIPSPR